MINSLSFPSYILISPSFLKDNFSRYGNCSWYSFFFFPVKMVPNLWWFYLMIFWCCCCSIAQSCLTLCDPMDCSWPGLPVPHYLWSLPKFMYVYRWCHPSISSSNTAFSCPQSFSASGTFPMSWLFPSDDQNTGTSASSSVLLTSIQGWFPWRLTGLTSCPRDFQESSFWCYGGANAILIQ